MSFPSSVPSYTGFTSGETLQAAAHASQHNAEQADIVAIATKVGTGASTASNNTVLRGNGAGTSAFGQVQATTDITGILPTSLGGTGTTSTTGTGSAVFGTSPTLSSPSIGGTVTGGATYNSPTLVTPTIASFANAQHNHSNAAGGGQLGTSAFAVGGLGSDRLSNPYEFHVYRNAAQNTGTGAFVVLGCDTAIYDAGSNVDLVTNKGRFTAPIAGKYWFNAIWQSGVLVGTFGGGISLFKNGARTLDGFYLNSTAFTNTYGNSFGVTGVLTLAANDYVEAQPFASSAVAITVGNIYSSYFQGELRSAT